MLQERFFGKNKKMNIMNTAQIKNIYYKIIQLLLNIVADKFVIFIPSNNYIMPLIDDVLYKIDFVFGLLFRIPKSRMARCFGSYLGSVLYEFSS